MYVGGRGKEACIDEDNVREYIVLGRKVVTV